MLLNKFLTYHKDASIEDLQWLSDFGMIGDEMTIEDYADACLFLNKSAQMRLESERRKSLLNRAFDRMRKSFLGEEVAF